MPRKRGAATRPRSCESGIGQDVFVTVAKPREVRDSSCASASCSKAAIVDIISTNAKNVDSSYLNAELNVVAPLHPKQFQREKAETKKRGRASFSYHSKLAHYLSKPHMFCQYCDIDQTFPLASKKKTRWQIGPTCRPSCGPMWRGFATCAVVHEGCVRWWAKKTVIKVTYIAFLETWYWFDTSGVLSKKRLRFGR